MSHEFEDRALKDEEFDEYLRRGTEVSQRYQGLGGREVPPALDARVLRQAQQQAAKSSGRRRPWLRWGAPLAFAATALIAITVVMQPEVVMQPAVNAPRAPEPTAESPVFESRAAESPVNESPKLVGAAPQDEAPAVLPESVRPAGEEDSASSVAVQARRAAKPKPAPATPPAAQPGASGSAGARADASVAQDRDLRDEERGAATERERNVQRAPAPAEPARPSKELKAAAQAGELQRKMSESVSKARADKLAAAAREESKGDAKSDAGSPAPVVPEPVEAVAPPPPPQAAAGLPKAPAAEPPPPEPAAEGVSTLEVDRITAPATWVRWIRDLRAQGNQVRAEELLKRLRAAHPSFALPADMAPPPQR